MTFAEMHRTLDVILAMYVTAHPSQYPSRTSILEVAKWLNEERIAEEEALRRAKH